jgi:hypothetical protein
MEYDVDELRQMLETLRTVQGDIRAIRQLEEKRHNMGRFILAEVGGLLANGPGFPPAALQELLTRIRDAAEGPIGSADDAPR